MQVKRSFLIVIVTITLVGPPSIILLSIWLDSYQYPDSRQRLSLQFQDNEKKQSHEAGNWLKGNLTDSDRLGGNGKNDEYDLGDDDNDHDAGMCKLSEPCDEKGNKKPTK
jgi:hypothetical protein